MKDTQEPTESIAPPRPGEEFQVNVDQRVLLTSGIAITLRGHTHKISEGDIDSPLGVGLTVHQDGRDEPWDGWVDLSGARVFTVAGVELELLDYEYDSWMRLRIK